MRRGRFLKKFSLDRLSRNEFEFLLWIKILFLLFCIFLNVVLYLEKDEIRIKG